MKHLGFWSWCHWRAKIIQVPDVDFRLIPTWCNQVCLQQRRNSKMTTGFMHLSHGTWRKRLILERGWRLRLWRAPCACHSQQWSRRSLQPWSLQGHKGWSCRSHLLRWGLQMGDRCHPSHVGPRPVCGICERNLGDEQLYWKHEVNAVSRINTCGRRWSCHKTSYPDMVP